MTAESERKETDERKSKKEYQLAGMVWVEYVGPLGSPRSYIEWKDGSPPAGTKIYVKVKL